MRDIAYRLGVAFGAEAERAPDRNDRLEFYRLFDRCFFCVRVSIALELRLTREARAAAAGARLEREADREDADQERPDWDEVPERYDERDRERDVERASLPVLLSALEDVAADAEALPGPKPAELPTLRELLARVKAAPAAAAPQAPAQGLRARLTSSGATATLTLDRPARAGPSLAPPSRRATGPPFR